MFRYSNGNNPNLGSYVSDAVEILSGMDSSGFNLASLLTVDAPEFARRAIRNRVPLTLVHALIDRIPGKDYHREAKTSDNPVVFLRHGYWTGAASMKGFGKVLDPAWGINNHQYDYTDYLPELADRLLNKVEKEKKSGNDVYVIAHSKGALVALYAYQQEPDLFDKIVTMATPFKGSEMADKYWWITLPFPPYVTLREFSPNNKMLLEMNRKGLPDNAQILNFYTNTDEFIKPFDKSKLPDQENVRNVLIPKIKHNAFLYDPVVQQMTRFFLYGFNFNGLTLERISNQLSREQEARLDKIVRVN